MILDDRGVLLVETHFLFADTHPDMPDTRLSWLRAAHGARLPGM